MTVELARDLTGTGPLLVLIHGITENRHTWDPLLDDLAADHRVLRVDLRGHGQSPKGESYAVDELAADVYACVSELGDETPMIVGHSLGGMVVTAYGAAYPTRGIVNVDQSLDLTGLQAGVKALEPMLRSDSFGLAITAVFDSLRGALPADETERVEGLRHADPDVVLGVWSVLLDQTPDELAATVAQLVDGVAAPYLSLHGIDPGPEYPAWLRERIPRAEVEVWPEVGHYPHLVRKAEFLARVRAFEAGLPA